MNILVYVRLPPDRDRTARLITFNTPPDIEAGELLDHVTAVDGSRCVIEVEDAFGPAHNLLNVERSLVTWLKSLGHTVDFR